MACTKLHSCTYTIIHPRLISMTCIGFTKRPRAPLPASNGKLTDQMYSPPLESAQDDNTHLQQLKQSFYLTLTLTIHPT